MSNKKGKTTQILCLGTVILEGNRKGVKYCILEDNKETAETMIFKDTKLTRGYPGNVYSAETDDGSIWNLQFVKGWHDRKRISELQLESRSNETHRTALAQQKKNELSDAAIMETIKPLQHIYRSTNALGKTSIIARVIFLMQRL